MATTQTRGSTKDAIANGVVEDAGTSKPIGGGLQRFPAQSAMESIPGARVSEMSGKLHTNALDNKTGTNPHRLAETDSACKLSAMKQVQGCEEATKRQKKLVTPWEYASKTRMQKQCICDQ
jgi:hypothetical protein